MATRKRNPKCNDRAAVAIPADDSADQLAELASALAHPARVRIVRLLISRQTCVCGELVDNLPLVQSTVFQHLKILKESRLIEGEVDGPKICYCINPQKLQEFKTLGTTL